MMEMKTSHNTRRGGPYDRGSADSYYGRPINPHYYVDKTGTSPLVPIDKMTKEEIKAYLDGFKDNEKERNFLSVPNKPTETPPTQSNAMPD